MGTLPPNSAALAVTVPSVMSRGAGNADLRKSSSIRLANKKWPKWLVATLIS
jgi:hypothetical protein